MSTLLSKHQKKTPGAKGRPAPAPRGGLGSASAVAGPADCRGRAEKAPPEPPPEAVGAGFGVDPRDPWGPR